MKTKHDHEAAREEFWCKVWLSASSAANIEEAKVASSWADYALAEFDKRFSPEAHEERGEKLKREAEKKKAKEAKSK